MNHGRKISRTPRGFTLVELMVSLMIFSLMSTAIISLMFTSYDINRQVRSENDLVSQVESTLRRIVDNTRSSSTPGPYFTSTHIDLYTQADTDHSNLKYNIQYYINAGGDLVEYHDLYGTNTLVHNCTAFTVFTLHTNPTVLQVTITAADGKNTVTRTCNITARNY
jgi:prepilin-type N-terminal cleavage/methylation domain-containing protein